MNIGKRLMVQPGKPARLNKRNPGNTLGIKKDGASLDESLVRLRQSQELLYADRSQALLIILQALDAGGKDGTIEHVMSGVNPQGCLVTSFKAPTLEDLDHDFLWRIHRHVPGRGMIGIFNRSQYEDVLIVRVHDLVPKPVWSERYEQINRFEEMLSANGVVILKFFLHISKEEQLRRFKARLTDPTKNWKFSMQDVAERKHWDEYIEAYEDALTRCSTKHAPWYVVPSDHKWFRNYAIASIVADTMKGMDLKFPAPATDLSKVRLK